MAYLKFKFFRAVDRFCDSVSVLRRLRDSMTETQAMLTGLCAFVLWLCAFFMFLVARSPGAESQNHTLMGLGSLLALLCLFVVLPLIGMASAIATCFAKHPGNRRDNLAKCISLLEGQGFIVQNSTQHSIYAKRGNHLTMRAHWEEWKEVPIQVLVTATDSDSSSTLEVQCLSNPFARRVLVPTTRAIAELDGPGLARLDREVMVKESHRGRYSGLGRNIFWSLVAFSIIGVAVTLWLAAVVQRNFHDAVMSFITERVFMIDMKDRVLDTLELPVRQEIDRQLTNQATDPELSSMERLGNLDPHTAEGRLVIALEQIDGTTNLILPRQGDVLEPLARVVLVSGIFETPIDIEKAGDRIFVRFSRFYQRKLAKRLGLKSEHLAVGLLLSYPELASLAPINPNWHGTELTYYRHGNSLLRHTWWQEQVSVDQGRGTLPREVIMDWTEDINPPLFFWRPNRAYAFHQESREDHDYWVNYVGESREGSWTGWSIAFRKEAFPSFLFDEDYLLFPIAQIGLAALVPLFLLVFICSPFIAARISRPVLAVRDALRSISDGDYSVRLPQDRKDEIGQLQEMVNHTAEELRKRESVKDLMGKYLSRQVADQILAGDSEGALAGIRKEVSVLFADIRGFTAYSERHDPEQVTKSLNEYFEVMVDVIAGHEGVLDKYLGDGLMVVFGAPMAQVDHARRAVITALEMQAALQSLNLKRLQRGDEPISIGIGVNTGLAISGNLGSLKRMEFTVIGDTVNTAARLESNAKQGQILIGRKTYEKVQDLIECEALGPIPVKGKAEPVEVWWLKGLKRQVKL